MSKKWQSHFFDGMRPAAAHSLRSHVCGPSRVFSDVHAAEKNEFDFFRACGREFCETALAVTFCAALRAVARFASQSGEFVAICQCSSQFSNDTAAKSRPSLTN
jgi:hypothetical protein